MATETITTSCVIAGGGPAGMMCGLLLARAGVDVLVLEKHADFLRDFRGDTIHPSTLQIMYELGLLDDFLKRPHQEVRELAGQIGDDRVVIADFSHLPTHCHFIALMPQWDFLDFLAEHAKLYPSFKLKMLAEVDGLLQDGDAIVGLTAKQPQGRLEVRSNLVIGADGRHSIVREKSGLKVEDLGAPMDVLWFRLAKRPDDGGQTLGRIQAGVVFVMLDRGDYWQCAYVIRKGGFAELRRNGPRGLPPGGRRAQPEARRSCRGNRLMGRREAPDRHGRSLAALVSAQGCCASAMPLTPCRRSAASASISPSRTRWLRRIFFGVRSAPAQRAEDVLRKVQERREWPTRATQRLQLFIQDRVISNVLALKTRPRAPLAVKLLDWLPVLRRIPARLLGLGFRPEHVRTPELPPEA